MDEIEYQDPEELEAECRRKREQELADLEWLLGDARGRRVLWRILEQAGVYRLSYTPDATLTAFNEGRRNLGLWLLSEVNEVGPERYAKMQLENTTP